jgi:DeoR/GlpR family transcriptional regulator of sugar metabolism
MVRRESMVSVTKMTKSHTFATRLPCVGALMPVDVFDSVDFSAQTRHCAAVPADNARAMAHQRHETIVAEVLRRGGARVADLADLLGVSDMTVRRDLDTLDELGRVVKVHGGASPPATNATDEPGFEAKSLRNTREKSAIAEMAAELVVEGLAIGITAGTTTWRLASELVAVANLTVVTNSIPVADVFNAAPRLDRTVVLTGGVRTPSDALVGPVAVAALRALHLDYLFMGVHGMSQRTGFTTPNLLEAETNRAFVHATDKLVVLADHTKWGVNGLASIAALSDAAVVVTDVELDSEAREVLEGRAGRVMMATAERAVTTAFTKRKSA